MFGHTAVSCSTAVFTAVLLLLFHCPSLTSRGVFFLPVELLEHCVDKQSAGADAAR